MRIGSLFTGCGGLDLGLELAGHQTVWACESDPACQRVLEHRFSDVPIVQDVRDVDASLPPVDVLAGGFPCQDLSYAGKGAGLDGDRSGLWHEFARAVRVLRPRHVIVENVSALSNRGLGRVLYDLAEAGYVGSWGCVRASDVGAPHHRERLFILASLADPGSARRREIPGGAPQDEGEPAGRRENGDHVAVGAGTGGLPAAGRPAAADADRGRQQSSSEPDRGTPARVEAPRRHDADGRDPAPPDADELDVRAGRRRRGTTSGVAARADQTPPPDAARGTRGAQEGQRPGSSEAKGGGQAGVARGRDALRDIDWGVYQPAIRRWEHLTRPAPNPTDERRRLDPRFVEWMLGFPEGWVDVPEVSRTAQLRMLGNSVQVQVGTVVGQGLAP